MPEIDIEPIRARLGTKVTDEDIATAAPLRGMVVTFDRDEIAPVEGQPIAPGWHLAYFTMQARATSG
jgi:3-methylfumaryl-CoA hydratase